MRQVKATDAFLSKLSQSTGIKLDPKSEPCLPSDASIKAIERLRDNDDAVFDRYLDPWRDADVSWSDEIIKLKELNRKFLEAKKKSNGLVTTDFVYNQFKTLRLHDMGIEEMDENFSKFPQLKELSLTGNLIQTPKNVPRSVEILDLNANLIQECPNLKDMHDLIHVGLGFNSLLHLIDASQWLPTHVLSLDLSWNHLYDLKETLDHLSTAESLRNLVLLGNPIRLATVYHPAVASILPNLYSLDEETIEKESRAITHDANVNLTQLFVTLTLNVGGLTGVVKPESSIGNVPDQPQDEFRYLIKGSIPSLPGNSFQTTATPWKTEVIEFVHSQKETFPIDQDFLKAWTGGLQLELVQERYIFVPKVQDVVAAPPSSAKKEKNDKGAAAKKVESAWIPKLDTTETIGYSFVSLKRFLGSSETITGDYHFQSKKSSPDQSPDAAGSLIGTVRIVLSL